MKPFRIEPARAQLLLIDLQDKMLPAVSSHETVSRNSIILLHACGIMNIPVKYTEHYPRGLGSTVSSIADNFPKGSTRTEKIHFSCCMEEGFDGFLRMEGRDQIVVAGVETHICVLGTVMDLLATDYRVAVAADACSSRNPEHHRLACEAMASAGALVVPVETLVYQMLGRAGTAEFKAMLPFFKE